MANEWRELPLTEPQKSAIARIESNTKRRFTGKTRGDGSDFIGAHIEESKENAREMWRMVNEEEAAEDIYNQVMEDAYLWGDK